MSFILSVIGVVLIVEGIPYFAFPGKVKDWALMLQEIPERGMRIIGLIAMATGLFILYMVKSL
jgi:uncharacterized protein YjeT (DUF2065 family)